MERLSSNKFEQLEQIDREADRLLIKDMSNTELMSFFYDARLQVGECNDLIRLTIDELIERNVDIRFGNNE